ncbi:MAG: PLP-dependent aminotransferase family protein [Oscillospiraceae bacterium]|jgi:2-aminoadipate transaminase|nr:PLP-dependent aminotransferase family protein [Oscillospiraceae bacterium]
MEYQFSDRISALKPSAIREILKVTSNPDVIPFAAGNPAPEAFPLDAVREISQKLLAENPILALQYSVTEGYAPLKQAVLADMKRRYTIGREFDEIIITSGAQQVMDLAAKVLCNEGDVIVCESPSFIGSLNSFRAYKAILKGVEMESDGMNLEKLEETLKTEKNVRFIYTIPNFQNPSGVTMSLEKRKKLYALAKRYGVLIVEDNPYGETRVAGENVPAIKSFDEDGIVIYAGSFSKILAPGLRVGFAIAPREIVAKMTVGKQGSDVHTPIFNQLLVYEWMTNYDFLAHIKKIQDVYRSRLNLMCDMIDSELGGFFNYKKPEGGLFIWGELPESVPMLEFVKEAAARKVAVVPGIAFMINADDRTNCIRLNFSTPTDEAMVKGMKILGELKKEY